MCLIFVAHRVHPDYRLVVAANRDEFYARPTAAAQFWSEHPDLLAGRDLEAGGTWLGVTRGGRFAALTNYRDADVRQMSAPSRGHLTSDFLSGRQNAEVYLQALRPATEYNGFGLLVSADEQLWYYSNRSGAPPKPLSPGVYGLSNHLLDTPWPKVEQGKSVLRAQLASGALSPEPLLKLMMDRAQASAAELPDTGLGEEVERKLSAMFIETPSYGTRSTTVILSGYDARTVLWERTFEPHSKQHATLRFEFNNDATTYSETGT